MILALKSAPFTMGPYATLGIQVTFPPAPFRLRLRPELSSPGF